MEEVAEVYFKFEKIILVEARTVEDKNLTDSQMSKMLGWAILSDTVW